MNTGIITIPTPINFVKKLHEKDRVTRWLKPKYDLKFTISAIKLLINDHIEPYIVQKESKIAVCRPNLRPKITQHSERHQFFALKKQGSIIAAGKNARRIESILAVLKNRIARNPKRLNLLKRNETLPIAEKCKLFGYTLMKQNEPFK